VAESVGKAWEYIHQEHKGAITRTFSKCGISIAIDGNEGLIIHILRAYSSTQSIYLQNLPKRPRPESQVLIALHPSYLIRAQRTTRVMSRARARRRMVRR